MQAVKSNVHSKFAKANSMQAFYCSAKTGDQVQNIFYRAACQLARVPCSKENVQAISKSVKAEIMHLPQVIVAPKVED